MSAKAVFEAAGVGNSEATALSAALSWALRDGTGMIGGLMYSYAASQYFDSHAKEFRLLLADVINDVALTLDMVAPWFGPDTSVWVLGLSTIGKTICGITAGATKGHITQHFAKDGGNVADLTAKESTQETLVSLLGMIGGVWVAKVLDRYCQKDLFFWTWLLFGILTAIHVWANYKAVSLLKLATLNPERTRVLFTEAIDIMTNELQQDMYTGSVTKSKSNKNSSPELLKSISTLKSPKLIEESLLSSTWSLVFPSICVSRSPNLNRLKDCSLYQENNEEMSLQYVIGYDAGTVVYVWLKVGATMEDELQSYVHALLLQKILSDSAQIVGSKREGYHTGLLQRFVTLAFHKICESVSNRVIELLNFSPNFFASLFRICFSSRKKVLQVFAEQSVGAQEKSISLMERLGQLGWDLRGRLHLGFASRRLQTSMKED